MLSLIFDTETSGFPLWKSPPSDPNQPHLVQLAALMTKGDEIISSYDTIVSCPVEISEGAAKVHGISTSRSRTEGVSSRQAVVKFDGIVSMADRIVCHNVEFDLLIMRAAYSRAEISTSVLDSKPTVCTMLTATSLLKLRGKRGYKWPKLDEAFRALVDTRGFEGAHSADADTLACWKVLRALENKGVELIS